MSSASKIPAMPAQPTVRPGRIIGPAEQQPGDGRTHEIALVDIIAEEREGAPVELRPTGETIVATCTRAEVPEPGTIVMVRDGRFKF